MSLIIISKITPIMKNLERIIFVTILILFPLFSFSQNENTTDQIGLLIHKLKKSEGSFESKKIIKKIIKLDPTYNSVIEEIRSNNYYSSNIYLPEHLLNFGDKKNELAIQIFSKQEESAFSEIAISSYKNVSSWVFWRNLFNIHLIQGAFVVAIILFLFFLFLFISYSFKEKKYIYFAMMCLFFAFGYLNIGFFHDSSNSVALPRRFFR